MRKNLNSLLALLLVHLIPEKDKKKTALERLILFGKTVVSNVRMRDPHVTTKSQGM